MEDAHLILPDMTEDANLFAIFDGHGGINYNFIIYCNFKIFSLS